MRPVLATLLLALSACAVEAEDPPTTGVGTPTTTARPSADTTVRLLFIGDIMLGRRVGPIASVEDADLFEKVRFVVSSADVAAGNLESPLTLRPHISNNPNELEADPDLAGLLAGAGFDLMSVANNHAGDAGPEGVVDTIDALTAVGIAPFGAGRDRQAAESRVDVDVEGIRIAFLAFDATGLGLEATEDSAGVARYETAAAHKATTEASSSADVVVVSIHGGVEYLLEKDPILDDIADDLVSWGADVVWGHGPHVPQPVTVVDGAAIVATSLGNFLFDQQRPSTQTGLVLEVLASRDRVQAFRIGRADHSDLRVRFTGWDLPEGPAVLLGTEWWSLVSTPELRPQEPTVVHDFPFGDITYADTGDVTGDGLQDLVASYRRPFRDTRVNQLYPDRDFTDLDGRSAHVGVFDPSTVEPRWAAGTLLRPVAELAVCDGSLALAFDELDNTDVVATGAWIWWDFGFATAPELRGEGEIGCLDVDKDGQTDPIILR